MSRDASQDAPLPGDGQASLPRILGPFDAMTVVIGSIIGSGIFLKPANVATELGPWGFGPILGVWVIVGLITLCGSLALAELAAMLPQAGGPYVYLREAYGRMPAFLWGWTEFWIVRTGSLGALAVGTVIYLSKGAELIDPRYSLPPAAQEALAVAIVTGLSAVNFVATRWAANIQNVTTVIKVAFLLGIIALPFVMGAAEPDNLQPVFASSAGGSFLKAFGIAAVAVLWPYDGWINIGPVAEEIRQPQRNVPLALAGGLLTVICVYAGANIAYHLVLPIEAVAASKEVAADVCVALLGDAGGIVMALGVMCSMFGATNSNMITGPRIYFAMARDGLLPRSICRVHSRFQTPSNAIVAQSVWTVALIVGCFHYGGELSPSDAFDALTNFVIFGGSIFYAMAVGAVFVLRWKHPEWERPYRTWGYPVVPALYLLFFCGMMTSLLVEDTRTSMMGLSLIALGGIYYGWARRRTAWGAPA